MTVHTLTKRKRPKAASRPAAFLRFHHAVVVAVNTAPTLDVALTTVLDLVCAHTGWPVGHAYLVAEDPAGDLVPTRIWHLAVPRRFARFRRVTEGMRLPRGVGLPGRVFATGKPAWVTDISREHAFPRVEPVTATGLKAAFAFPILVQRDVVGVLEFYATAAIKPDTMLLEVVRYIGMQLGRVFERERAGDKLRESDNFAKTVISSVGRGVIVYDRDLRYRMWNKFMEDLTGLSPAQVIGRAALELFPHLAEHGVDRLLNRALAGETVESADIPYRVPETGRTGWVRGLYTPHTSSRGEIIGVVGVVRDVTEDRLTQESLRRSEERFRALIEHSSDGILLIDAQGTVRYASPPAERIMGYAAGEFTERTVVELIHHDDLSMVKAVLTDLRQRPGGTATARARLRRKEGSWRWMECVATNPLAQTGVGRIVMNFRDVTDRVQSEEEIRIRSNLMGRLVALSERLNRSVTVDEVVSAIGESAMSLSGADRVAVYLRGPDGARTRPWSQGLSERYIAQVLARQHELPVEELRRGPAVDRLEPSGGRGVAGQRPFLLSDIRSVPDEGIAQLAEQEGFRALSVWPLTYEGRIVANVSCYHDAPHDWSQAEQEIFQAFCWEAAVALQNARLYEGQVERATELEAIATLSRQLRAAATTEQMYPILVEQARLIVSADHGSLALLDAERERLTRVYTVGLINERPGSTFPVAGSRAGDVVQTGVAHVSKDFAGDGLPAYPPPSQGSAVGPLAIVPMRSEREIIGTVTLARLRRPDVPPFTEAEIRLMEGIAELGGMAIQRARLHQNLEEAYIQMVLALASAVDARDTYTSDHSERMATWAEAIARAAGCGEDEVEDIRRAARLHDIGKIGIPDSILRKPMALTEAEWGVMRRHPLIGEEILNSVDRMRNVAKLVRHHQERWDGTGYPDGLAGEQIPLGDRILAVVDAYSAIIDDRPYKVARSHDEAIAELRRCAGTQFDPRIVEIFCEITQASRAGVS